MGGDRDTELDQVIDAMVRDVLVREEEERPIDNGRSSEGPTTEAAKESFERFLQRPVELDPDTGEPRLRPSTRRTIGDVVMVFCTSRGWDASDLATHVDMTREQVVALQQHGMVIDSDELEKHSRAVARELGLNVLRLNRLFKQIRAYQIRDPDRGGQLVAFAARKKPEP